MEKEKLSEGDYGKKLYSYFKPEIAKTKMRRYWLDIFFYSSMTIGFTFIFIMVLLDQNNVAQLSTNQYILVLSGIFGIVIIFSYKSYSEYQEYLQEQKKQMLLYEKAIILLNKENNTVLEKYLLNSIKTVYTNPSIRTDHIGMVLEINGKRKYEGIRKRYIHNEEYFLNELKKLIPTIEKEINWNDMKREVKEFNKQSH